MNGVQGEKAPIVSTAGVAISILAGGLSTRMGRDKARMRLGRSTLLGRVRKIAGGLGLPVRIIRRDLVPRCGPLGGIYTALKTSRAGAELFLACDMPFITLALLRRVARLSRSGRKPVFTVSAEGAGFPLLIPACALAIVETQIRKGQWSLQGLAQGLGAAKVVLSATRAREVLNVNSPEDWRRARASLTGEGSTLRPNQHRRITRKSPLSARRVKVMVRP